MRVQPFDIVVVPFPYADCVAEKRRPAVVISAPIVSDRYKLVWLAMVTSAANPRWECDADISELGHTPFAPSRIRPGKIATADVALWSAGSVGWGPRRESPEERAFE